MFSPAHKLLLGAPSQSLVELLKSKGLVLGSLRLGQPDLV